MWFRERSQLSCALRCAQCGGAGTPTRDYLVLVASEAVDHITRVRFGPGAGPSLAKVEANDHVGLKPRDPDGPHGVAVSPDGSHYYVTTAHGTSRSATLWKIDARTTRGRRPRGARELSRDAAGDARRRFRLRRELQPARRDGAVECERRQHRSDRGGRAHPDLHHAARLAPQQRGHEALLGVHDGRHARRDRHARAGGERATSCSRREPSTAWPARRARVTGHATRQAAMPATAWTRPRRARTPARRPGRSRRPTGARIFVACNKTSDIVEIDATSWTMTRRIPAGRRRLQPRRRRATARCSSRRTSAASRCRSSTSRPARSSRACRRCVASCTASSISPDDRYAFISVEGIGSEPGTVEVIDLRTQQRVASADVGQMAGGIDVVKNR